jgi:hypothetical protein
MAVPGRNASTVVLRDAKLGRVTERVDDVLERVRGVISRD